MQLTIDWFFLPPGGFGCVAMDMCAAVWYMSRRVVSCGDLCMVVYVCVCVCWRAGVFACARARARVCGFVYMCGCRSVDELVGG